MHSYQHQIKTFNNATRHLTRVERALYRDLIELYYDTEKPLISDFQRLCRLVLATSDEEKQALEYVLGEFFILTGEVYTHNYCDEQIEKYRAIASAKAKAGVASAEVKKQRAEQRIAERINTASTNVNTCATDVQQIRNKKQEIRNKNKEDITNPNGFVPASINTNPKNKTPVLIKTTIGEETELQIACRETWAAYSAAYAERYGTEPVRNARVNSLIKQFVQRIRARESPHVVASYLANNSAFYVKKMHAVDVMLKDAEKLRTEWATNKRVTDTEARQADQTQQRGDVWGKLIEEARNAATK